MGKKGNKRKTRWRVLPIGGDDADCLYSTNEDDGDGDLAAASPTAASGPGSYARAAQPGRGKPGSKPRSSGYQPAYYRPHRSLPDSRQPLVTTEKKTFNEEEYTKITTPRQDVLFKKGYLGRKKTVSSGVTASGAQDSASASGSANASAVTGAALTATNCVELAPMHNGGDCEPLSGDQADVLSPTDEQPQYIYPNGYVDGVIYVNGGYEWYDPYGNVTVVVGPAPPFAGPAGGASVLAAVPCQPLPLQPIEWFNPAYTVPYVAPALPSCPRERDRRKRCSADSQNCSPQSSESTDPPGSPQEGDGEGECEGEAEVDDGMLPALPGMINGSDEYTVYPHLQAHPPPQPPAYMYPGAYMFGQPVYNLNGITVQSTSQLSQNTENSGSKRRKKKRRRRRRRGGVDDGSEETSSDEKDLEEPVSLTSQESSQEVESDSKNSAGSASCPTIVGCPELPERIPVSPSSSPSLSPSLSPSPSLSNATDDKTALPKINYVDTNVQQEKHNIRCEGNKGNIETENEFSLQSVTESNSLSHVPNVEKSENVLKLNESNLQNQSVIHNGGSSINQVLMIDDSKINGNYLADSGISFEFDNNLSKTDSFSVSVCGDSKIESNIGFNKESVAKSNISVSTPKSKGKKGLKIQKQKDHIPIQNGFSELNVNETLSNFQRTQVKMDGNETLLSQDNIPSNENQALTTAKKNVSQTECKILPEQNIQQDENNSLSNVDISSKILTISEAPKKPARIHQSRQQQKSSSPCSPTSSQEKGQEENSTNPEKKQTKEELGQFTVPQYDHNTSIDLTFAAVPASESILKSSAHENVSITTHNVENTPENESTDGKVHAEELATEAVICEFNSPKMLSDKSIEITCIQSMSEQKEYERSGTQQDVTKEMTELSVLKKLDTIQGHTALGRCDNNQTSSHDVNNFFCTFPEWATSTPPIPPPRRKKWQAARKCSSDHPTPGKELESRKQKDNFDDASSSSSHESEESVIDLMSSSLNKSKNSRDLMNEIGNTTYGTISTQLGLQQNAQAQNINIVGKDIAQGMKLIDEGRDGKQPTKLKVHASEPDKSTGSISKQFRQISKGDQSQNRYTGLKDGLLAEENCHVYTKKKSETAVTDHAAETYADDLACQLLGEGLSNAATTINNTFQSQSLSLTEAVTQWLHSQDSDEVLQVPQLLESESDVDDTEEVSEGEIQMTGPKNVYRNPLLASSCESENETDDASIRVAYLKNTNTRSTRKITVACQINEVLNSLIKGRSLSENNAVITLKRLINEENEENNGNGAKEANEVKEANDAKEAKETVGAKEGSGDKETLTDDSHYNITLHGVELNNHLTETLKEDIIGEEFNTEETRQCAKRIKSEEFCNFTNESVEYDTDWENDQVILKTSPNITTMFITDDQESHLSLESNDSKFFYMCDPSHSVAKYYKLNPPPEKDINSTEIANDFGIGREEQDDDDNDDDDNDDNDDDAEGMDALIHFRNELNEYKYSTGVASEFQPESYSVERYELPNRKNNWVITNAFQKNKEAYNVSDNGFTSDSGIQSEESSNEDSHQVINSNSKSISQMNSILKRKSAIVLGHLGAESQFPCGGICCILQ